MRLKKKEELFDTMHYMRVLQEQTRVCGCNRSMLAPEDGCQQVHPLTIIMVGLVVLLVMLGSNREEESDRDESDFDTNDGKYSLGQS